MVTDRAVNIRRLGEPGDLGWVVMAHGEVYAAEFGWDKSFEALVARIVADYAAAHDPVLEAAWIAECDGERVGCVFCVAKDDTTARVTSTSEWSFTGISPASRAPVTIL